MSRKLSHFTQSSLRLSRFLTGLCFLLPSLGLADLANIQTQLLDEYRTRQSQSAEGEQQQEVLQEKKDALTQQLDALRAQMQLMLDEMSRLDAEIQALTALEQPPRYDLSQEDWDSIIANGTIGNCTLSPRDAEGFYTIRNQRSEAIRFKPLVDESATDRSYGSLQISGSSQSSAPQVQIIQPAYALDPQGPENMEANLDYRVADGQTLFGHVSFFGQKVGDRTFGRSSYERLRIVCKTGVDFN